MSPDAIGLALSLLLGGLAGPTVGQAAAPAVRPAAGPFANLLGALPDSLSAGLPGAPDRLFHPRERAVGGWRWQAAGGLDASPGTRAAILLGRDPAAVSRCVRLNNYWCVKRGGWSGEIAADGEGHVAFASAAEGAAVAALLLRRYYIDYGRRSALAIVSRWAPASCGVVPARPGRGRVAGTSVGAAAGASRRGIGGTLRARWLASHGRRVAGFGRLRGRASSVPDPLIGAALPAPAIALGIGTAPASLAASLPELRPESLAARPGAPPPPGPACAGDALRIRNYAARAAAGIAASPEADLGLFDALGRPTPRLAQMMRNMASVEIGPLGAGQGLVEAGIARAEAAVAARRTVAAPTAADTAAAPNPGAPTPGAPNPGAPNPGAPNPGAPNPGAPNPGAPNPGAPAPARLDEPRPPEPNP